MKKILILIYLSIPSIASAQVTSSGQSATNAFVYFRGGLAANGQFSLPRDTSISYLPRSEGSIGYDIIGHKPYYHDNVGWKPFLVNNIAQAITAPSYTTTQRNALPSPNPGDIIYNITTLSINFYNGTSWKEMLTD